MHLTMKSSWSGFPTSACWMQRCQGSAQLNESYNALPDELEVIAGGINAGTGQSCLTSRRGGRKVRIVHPWRGRLSFRVMRHTKIISIVASLLAVLAVWSAVPAQAQSSSSQPSQVEPPKPLQPANGAYVVVDPLAGVSYDNRYDISVGMAYDHMKAGPTLLQGSNLGGLDLTGTMWFSKHWGVQTSERAYLGSSGAGINAAAPGGGNIRGPFVAQYFFTAGAVWLGPHNKHGAILAHALGGGVYGQFEKELRGNSPSVVAFYNDQLAPAAIIGGSFDLNRSSRWVFRVTPDAVVTHYGINYYPKTTQFDVNFAISVGVEYKFSKKR